MIGPYHIWYCHEHGYNIDTISIFYAPINGMPHLPHPGVDGGMVGDLSYGFCILPHIWGIIIGSFPHPHPYPPCQIAPISSVVHQKSQTNIDFQFF